MMERSAVLAAWLHTKASRRPALRALGALGLSGLAALAPGQLTATKEAKRRRQRKHERTCRQRRKACRKENRLECANCHADPPPPPPDWTGSPEKWVELYCGNVCFELCELICLFV